MRKSTLIGCCAVLLLALLLGWWSTQEPMQTSARQGERGVTESIPRPAAQRVPDPAKTPAAAAQSVPATVASAGVDPLLQLPLPPSEALRLLELCSALTRPDPSPYLEQQWLWLGEQAAALERASYAKARASFIRRCGPWVLERDSDRARALKAALLERASHSTDLADRLRALLNASLAPNDAPAVVEARLLLEAALRSGRPELLRDVGNALERSEMAHAQSLGPYAGGGAANLFTLLACDLGMPCGANSEVVQLHCALLGRCGYADYESMLFDAALGARQRELVQTHRAELLRRIRAGQIQGLFDPIRLPAQP